MVGRESNPGFYMRRGILLVGGLKMGDTLHEGLDAAEAALSGVLSCRVPTVHDSVTRALSEIGDARRALWRWSNGAPDTRCEYCGEAQTVARPYYIAWACGRESAEDGEVRTLTCYRGEACKLRRELDEARRKARED